MHHGVRDSGHSGQRKQLPSAVFDEEGVLLS